MSDMTGDSLSKAYKLIEADELGAARAILEPIVVESPDNVDAWWLYAHAVSDPAEARRAIDNVLRLDPNYPGAAELSSSLESVATTPATPASVPVISKLSTQPTVPVAVPATSSDEEDLPEEDMPVMDEDEEDGGGSLVRPIAIAAIAVAAALLALVFLLPAIMGTPTVTPTPSSLVQNPTLPSQTAGGDAQTASTDAVGAATAEAGATEGVDTLALTATAIMQSDIGTEVVVAPTAAPTEAVETEEAVDTAAPTRATGIATEVETEQIVQAATTRPTAQPTAAQEVQAESTDVTLEPDTDASDAIIGALSQFTLPPDGIGSAQTDAGETLLVTVCSSAGQQIRADLPAVMNIVGKEIDNVASNFQAVGARMYDCEKDHVILIIVVPREEAALYAEGGLTDAEYQQFWLPQ
jgi:hypothetical protein